MTSRFDFSFVLHAVSLVIRTVSLHTGANPWPFVDAGLQSGVEIPVPLTELQACTHQMPILVVLETLKDEISSALSDSICWAVLVLVEAVFCRRTKVTFMMLASWPLHTVFL